MDLASIKDLLQTQFKFEAEWEEELSRLTLPAEQILPVCEFLWKNPATYFDSLSCLTAIDQGPEAGKMEVIYTLYSIPNHLTLHLRVILDRSSPTISSVSSIWRTADWHEREAFDLLGVQFSGHPDLRRILLPEDWEGHPLRKDYVEQSKYHGIQVKY
ncbi:MAG: NADH-quinone oxidoreductase subunit C [Cytophagales bacterium]|nr:NADH-quinone oxidoreductase subunit C [Cytophagales bacterium]